MAISRNSDFKFLLNYPEGEYRIAPPWWKKTTDTLFLERNGPMLLLTRRYKARKDVCFEFDSTGRLVAYMEAVGKIWRVLWQYGQFHPIFYLEAHDVSAAMAIEIKKSVRKYGFPGEQLIR